MAHILVQQQNGSIHVLRLLTLLSIFIFGIFIFRAAELFPQKVERVQYSFPIGDQLESRSPQR